MKWGKWVKWVVRALGIMCLPLIPFLMASLDVNESLPPKLISYICVAVYGVVSWAVIIGLAIYVLGLVI